MKRSVVVLTIGTAFAIVAGLTIFAHGGDLNPPAGPVAPTMKTLNEISAQIAALGPVGGGGTPKRVVRGVLDFANGEAQKTASFSPAIDPAKSFVDLSQAIYTASAASTTNSYYSRNGSCLIGLTATTLTVATDAFTSLPRQVSYQIIEYP